MKVNHFKKALALSALASAFSLAGCQKEEILEEQATPSESVAPGKHGQFIEGQYIVVFKDGTIGTSNTYRTTGSSQFVQATLTQSLMAKAGIKSNDIRETYQGAMNGFAARLTPSQLQDLRNSPEVAYIEQDRYIYINSEVTPSPTSGKIIREQWDNVIGSAVSDIPLHEAPSSVSELETFEAPANVGLFYGARIRGYVTAPVTGQYTFWIAADDDAELWLSTSVDTTAKVKIAHVNGITKFREWNKFSTQESAPVTLEAGKRYYIEALHKEEKGSDHLSVGWQLPDGTLERPIAGNRLSTFDPNAKEAPTSPYQQITPLPGELVTWNVALVGYGDGTGKNVWIVDTGIDTDHPDLNVDLVRSKSFVSGITSVEDGKGHGTSVAGIIAAKNNGSGLIGVASGATVIALRVFNDTGGGTMSNLIAAALHLDAHAQPGDVVNISAGGGVSSTLDNVIKSVAAKGVLFAIAAGNTAVDCSTMSPARIAAPNVFTISAMDKNGRLWDSSNYGPRVAFAAPGVNVTTTVMGGSYGTGANGTSFAAPHVAGILLLRGKVLSKGTVTGDKDAVPDPIASLD